MKTPLRGSGLTLVALGVLVSVWQAPAWARSRKSHEAQTATASADLERKTLNDIQDFNRIFTDVAEHVLPSVVTILSSRQSSSTAVPDSVRFERPRRSPPSGSEEALLQDLLERRSRWRDRRPPSAEKEDYEREIGSGVIFDERGYLLTNHHVVEGADRIRVRLYDRRTVEAEVVGTDPRTDLAVLRISASGLRAGKLGDSDALRVGEWVLCMGSPLNENLEHTVTAGIVSAKGRSNIGLAEYEDYIQTDAAINPGNSGGPMLNLRGEVVGINTALYSASGGFQGIGFSVPSNMAREIVSQLLRQGRVIRGWLGVSLQEIDETLAAAMGLSSTAGVLVGQVFEASPAARGGIEVGDVILTMNGQTVREVLDIRKKVASTPPGTEVPIELVRKGVRVSLIVQIDELGDEQDTMEEIGFSATLGMGVQELTPELMERHALPQRSSGIVVVEIERGKPASNAGMQVGDLIRTVDGQPVSQMSDFQSLLQRHVNGSAALLFIQRAEETLFVGLRMPSLNARQGPTAR